MNLQETINAAATIDDLIDLGIQFQKKTVESLLVFAKIVYTLKDRCEGSPEYDFQELALEKWGLSNSSASQFAKIGRNAEKLIKYSSSLPASSRSLYELTQLPYDKLDEFVNLGDITPASTVKDIQAIKETIKEEKQQTKKKEKSKKITENISNIEQEDSDEEDNPFKVDVKDEEGNKLDAELVEEKQPKKKTKKKMSVIEALDILKVDLTVAYFEAKKEGVDENLLREAFYTLTGEKI